MSRARAYTAENPMIAFPPDLIGVVYDRMESL